MQEQKHRGQPPAKQSEEKQGADAATEPRDPTTVPQAAWERLQAFHRDERTGVTPAEQIEEFASAALGDRIAPGLYVAHTGGTAQLHLLDLPVQSTMKEFEASQEAFIRCLREKELVQGITPSKNALRVMVLLLKSFPELSKEGAAELTKLRKEAAALDLNNPGDPNWKRTCTIDIGGESFDVSLSLKTIDPLSRLGTVLVGLDIPKEQRTHKHGFRLELRPSEPTKTEALRILEHRGLQLRTAAALSTPIALAVWASSSFMPAKVLPTFTSNAALQSISEFGAQSLPMVLAAAGSVMAMRFLQRRRFG